METTGKLRGDQGKTTGNQTKQGKARETKWKPNGNQMETETKWKPNGNIEKAWKSTRSAFFEEWRRHESQNTAQLHATLYDKSSWGLPGVPTAMGPLCVLSWKRRGWKWSGRISTPNQYPPNKHRIDAQQNYWTFVYPPQKKTKKTKDARRVLGRAQVVGNSQTL